VVAALRESGLKAWGTAVRPLLPRLVRSLGNRRPDVVFNLVDERNDDHRAGAQVAAVLEWMGLPAVGSGQRARAICWDFSSFAAVTRGSGLATWSNPTSWQADIQRVPLLALPGPLPLDGTIEAEAARLAVAGFRAIGARDWGECHLVRDDSGAPHLFGFEAVPDIGPDGLLAGAFRSIGTTYSQALTALALQAWRRGESPGLSLGPERIGAT
jgi:D-alanine-D-alanine ligase-like ATP-grasp enzyme